jgi:transposase
LQSAFHTEQLHQPALVEQAVGQHTLALVAQLSAACRAAEQLAEAATTTFRRHPDAWLITSLPGLGELTGARVLAETGDDPTRFADARALKAYAGAAPVTRASGNATWSWPARSTTSAWPASATSGLRRLDRLTRRPRPLRPATRRR